MPIACSNQSCDKFNVPASRAARFCPTCGGPVAQVVTGAVVSNSAAAMLTTWLAITAVFTLVACFF